MDSPTPLSPFIPKKAFPTFNELKEMHHCDENQFDSKWSLHERHFFVFTNASRPVYIRYGDETVVMPILCTVLTFLARCHEWKQKLKTMTAGDKLFVFYNPSSIIYVCVSSIKLPISLLEKELMTLENVLFSLLSPSIMLLLKDDNDDDAGNHRRKRRVDIQRQIGGAERLFTSALHLMDNDLCFVFNSCIQMAALTPDRQEFSQIVHNIKSPNINAVVVFHEGDVFLIVEKSFFHLTPEDILILSNNTYPPSDSLDNSWAPIWLPGHEESLHILTVDVKAFDFKMILIGFQIEDYNECTAMAESIVDAITGKGLLQKIVGIQPFGNSGLKSWVVANHTLGQVYSPYRVYDAETKRIYTSVAWVYEYLKSSEVSGPFYVATGELTLFGRHSKDETLVGVGPIGLPPSKAQQMLNEFEQYYAANKNVFFDFNRLIWNKE